jgi:hypothetical protein
MRGKSSVFLGIMYEECLACIALEGVIKFYVCKIYFRLSFKVVTLHFSARY